MAVPALPPLETWVAPPGWSRVDFLSDLHLSATTPRTFAGFAAHLSHTPADAVFILGDLFEVWVGDEQRHGAFERHVVQVLAAAAARVTIAFLPGNRDFLVGPGMAAACGLRLLRDPTRLQVFGRRLLLSHGDELCVDDIEYQAFRAEARGPAWQAAFLAQPLDVRLGQALEARAASEARKRATGTDPDLWADVDTAAALAWLHAAQAESLVHGHTHRPASLPLDDAHQRHVLSDWDLDHGARAEVLSLTREGLRRLAPSTGG